MEWVINRQKEKLKKLINQQFIPTDYGNLLQGVLDNLLNHKCHVCGLIGHSATNCWLNM